MGFYLITNIYTLEPDWFSAFHILITWNLFDYFSYATSTVQLGCLVGCLVGWLLESYILGTFKVLSGPVQICDSVHSSWLHSTASMGNQSTWIMTPRYPTQSYYPDTELTSPCPILLILRQVSILYVISLQRPENELPISCTGDLRSTDSATAPGIPSIWLLSLYYLQILQPDYLATLSKLLRDTVQPVYLVTFSILLIKYL